MLIGLDGFVDEIIHVVRKRQDFKVFERVDTIAELGERISRSAGYSANIELVPKQTKLGGNGPIFANALIKYGVDVTYVGALGKPDIHPIFREMATNSKCYTLCEPGHTDALEFNDGKLMLGKVEVLGEITWQVFKDAFGGAQNLALLIEKQQVFGMENWTMIPHMSDIWEGIISEVFPLLPTEFRAFAFFDIADPEKRSQEDIKRALSLLKRFNEKFSVILGLNEKECYEIAETCGVKSEALESVAQELYGVLGIDFLVVHPTKRALCVSQNGFFQAAGPYCQKPVLTTGAGDNFNAGFCYAKALGFDEAECLTLGVATSGFYVRNGRSTTFDEVLGFLYDWENGFIDN